MKNAAQRQPPAASEEPKPVPMPAISGALTFFDDRTSDRPSARRISGITQSTRILLADPVRRAKLKRVVAWTIAVVGLIGLWALIQTALGS